jgi:hypothetical protein
MKLSLSKALLPSQFESNHEKRQILITTSNVILAFHPVSSCWKYAGIEMLMKPLV